MLEDPPVLPELEVEDLLEAGEGDCPAELAPRACLSSAGAVKIRRALADLVRYAADAATACGVRKEGETE